MDEKRNIKEFTRDIIESYNNFLSFGIKNIVKYVRPVIFDTSDFGVVTLTVQNFRILEPRLFSKEGERKANPWEFRRTKGTYEAAVEMTITASSSMHQKITMSSIIGTIPIMVMSNKCLLANKTSSELVALNEEPHEVGGYFIVGGLQYITRPLILQRRNFPVNVIKDKDIQGTQYTGHVCSIRCVREDETVGEMRMRWKKTKSPDVVVQMDKKLYNLPLPVILMALQQKTPQEIVEDVPISSDYAENKNIYLLVKDLDIDSNFLTQNGCLEWLGSFFRLKYGAHSSVNNVDVGRWVLQDYIAVHLPNNEDKYRLLLSMFIKLLEFYTNMCSEESLDTLNFHELLTTGSLFQQLFRMNINYILSLIPFVAKKHCEKRSMSFEEVIRKSAFGNKQALRPMHYLLSTGTIFKNRIIPGLKQSTALSIVLDNINIYRYLANFRSYHRGSFFQDTKSSAVRRMRPEGWGFQCPVNTPDGTPCGILNHLSLDVMVQPTDSVKEEDETLEQFLRQRLIPANLFGRKYRISDYYLVMLNGKVVGYIENGRVSSLYNYIRYMKVMKLGIPATTEVVLIMKTGVSSQYSGLYLFSTAGRLLRPVINTMYNRMEMIGTFEQTYLMIGPADSTDNGSCYSHKELSNQSIYSFTASFTPYQNHNPSPRNLYQCQMSKQSMGFTYYRSEYRAEKKLYSFRNPQVPLTVSKTYDKFDMSLTPLGYNPIVSVLSSTGYDMEDAMVINVTSLQRGMASCCLLKSYIFDFRVNEYESEDIISCGDNQVDNLCADGLPAIGTVLKPGTAICCKYNKMNGKIDVEKYKEDQEGIVYAVSKQENGSYAIVNVRVERRTVIGDKFSSRHGQKGVNSLQLRQSDLPFNDDGISADQLFNPHGFPSRMTMGMLIEFVAGKLAAVKAQKIDCSPFQSEETINGYSEDMKKFHYHGDGEEFVKDNVTGGNIRSVMGIIYYQRLRHMVSDKFQVRAAGPIDARTRQPLKGRRKGGGVRLGEMERDGLLSHGAMYVLQDRMVDCSSDKVTVVYCTGCKTFLHTYYVRDVNSGGMETSMLDYAGDGLTDDMSTLKWRCRNCFDENGTVDDDDDCLQNGFNDADCGSGRKKQPRLYKINIPAVTRHMMHQLSRHSMAFELEIEEEDEPELITS